MSRLGSFATALGVACAIALAPTFFVPPVLADTVKQSGVTDGGLVALQQWDPSLGVLTSATFELAFNANTLVTVTNPYSSAATLLVLQRAWLYAGTNWDNVQVLADLLPRPPNNEFIPIGPNQTLTFSGPVTWGPYVLKNTNPDSLSHYSGTGTFDVFLETGVQSEMRINGLPVPSEYRTLTWISPPQLSVTATFSNDAIPPVPVPPAFVLMLSGLGLLAVVVQRKRRVAISATG